MHATPRGSRISSHGVERLLSEQEAFKRQINTLHERGDFERFKAQHIVEAYRAVLTRALAP